MTVDPAWEAAHAARAWGKYPHPAVVDFIGRHYGVVERGYDQRGCAVDLGCGAGASAIFMVREGYDVVAVDSSRSALDRVADRMVREPVILAPRLRLFHSDVATFDAPLNLFDVVTDVCCLSCIPEDEALAVIERVHGWLKPGGRFLSVMAAYDCDHEIHGEFEVRQASSATMARLFSPFEIGRTFYGKYTRLTPRGFISEWVVEAQK